MPLMSDFEKEDNNNDITESINDLIEEVQEEDENKDKIKSKRILPKLTFFDFFLNNVYMPKCNSQSPIPNPQSPIPNPHISFYFF